MNNNRIGHSSAKTIRNWIFRQENPKALYLHIWICYVSLMLRRPAQRSTVSNIGVIMWDWGPTGPAELLRCH